MRNTLWLIGTLCMPAILAQSLDLRDTPLYGPTAVLTGGRDTVQVALLEGGRIVSWQVDGREIGFVGRIWGGDMADSLRLGDASAGLRFHRPTAVATQVTPGRVAVRVAMAVTLGETTVAYERIVGMDRDGLFLETTFPFPRAPGPLRYAFEAQFLRQRPGADPMRLLYRDAGQLAERPLDPAATRDFALPDRAVAATDRPRRGLGVAAPDADDVLILVAFGRADLAVKVWSASFALQLHSAFADSEAVAPIRLRAFHVSRVAAPSCLDEPTVPWPEIAPAWQPMALPEDAPPAARPATPPVVTRFGPYGACNGDPSFMAPLAAAGLGWVRVGAFSWSACEPERGRVHWEGADAALEAAEREGLGVIGEMSGLPGWAARGGDRRAPPLDWRQWEGHVERTVRRYRHRVPVWEIWNEPDIGQFFQGTVEEYTDLLRHAYAAAKRADPDCLVMSAGLDGSGETYLVRMLEAGAAECCDLVGAHPYASTPDLAVIRMRVMRRILDHFQVHKPLWITEVGWQSGGWKAGPGVVRDEDAKARMLREAIPGLLDWADVVCWYKGFEAGSMYGLMQPVGAHGFVLQPAWHAMRDLAMPAPKDVTVTAPETLSLPAGHSTAAIATVHNRSRDPVSARWLGAEPQWGTAPAVRVEPGSDLEIPIRLLPEPYARPHARDLILALQRDGRHVAGAVVPATVTNAGTCRELSLGGGWIRRLDAEGNESGAWTPAHEVVTAPGHGFIQPLRPTNLGSAPETVRVEVAGSAAGWLTAPPGEISLAPGQTGWVGLRVRVPENTPAGTYRLSARIRSSAQPEVQADFTGQYTVGSAASPK
ncbi:MAG: beta-galactosidase [Lentisphaeria bacterium]|nr:beta-galactosidase [Lentisphaeria bacterium]